MRKKHTHAAIHKYIKFSKKKKDIEGRYGLVSGADFGIIGMRDVNSFCFSLHLVIFSFFCFGPTNVCFSSLGVSLLFVFISLSIRL